MGERKYQPVAFSSLKFLREIENESLQRLHLRQWLILISRALWIAMLVLAIALPFFHSSGGQLDPGIIIIDKSFSTQSDPDFVKIGSTISDKYQHWLNKDYNEQSQVDTLKAQLKEYIDNNKMDNPNILWLTDLQNNAQNKAMYNMFGSLSERIFVLKKVKSGPNRAISNITLQNDPSDDMNRINITYTANEPPEKDQVIFINVNGKRIGQVFANETGHASYAFTKIDEKESMCSVNIRADDYPEDNTRYMVIDNAAMIKLLCVHNAGDAYYHVNALKAMNNIDLTDISADKITSVNLNDFDMIWLSDLYPMNQNSIERLTKYSSDHPLLITTGRPLSAGDPWYEMLGKIEETVHPEGSLMLINSNGKSMPDMPIDRYFKMNHGTKETIWSANNGDPIWVNYENNIYVLLTPFNFKWNKIGLSTYFMRELNLAMNIMLKREGVSFYCGEHIPLPGSFSEVTTPAGEEYRVKDIFTETRIPGFYRIENMESSRTVAVNIPDEECIQTTISDPMINILPWDGEGVEGIDRLIRGRNTQTLFFILASIFIILEMLLLRKGERTN
jgi:hypothetical protein